MVGYAPRGPLLGGAPPPQLGQQPTLGGWQPSLDFLTKIPGAIQQATGWQPGTTPGWVPDWLRNLSSANTAETQATQQNLAALPPRYAMTPQDINTAMSLGMNADILAYHGSPHVFDAFDASKIGTGEGRQAYGHGLYFAENPDVAADYRNKLSPMTPAEAVDMTRPDQTAQQEHGPAWDALVQQKRAILANDWRGDTSDVDAQMDALHQRMVADTVQRNPPKTGGALYKVDIQPEPEQFLDWDKPLSEQSPQVQQAIAATGAVPKGSNPVGSDIWQNVVSQHGLIREGAAPLASQTLRQAGIPGIRYLDQGSRGADEGTHNYVVFDPAHIKILERNNQPIGPMLGAQPQLGK